MSLFKSACTVGGLTLVSRILGYIRDILIASFLGAGALADAFFVAFRLPNFFRQLFAEGAFNAAFIPLFSDQLQRKGQEKAFVFAQHILMFMGSILIILTLLMEWFMPYVIMALAPGFLDDPLQYDTTIYFARIAFPYLVFISLCAIYAGIMQSFGRFAAAAFLPCLLNIAMIICLVYLSPFVDSPAHALALSVPLAGILQLLWIYVASKRQKISLGWSLPHLDNDVKTLLKRMVPGMIGGSVTQISVWINTILATTMSGAVSYLYYADRLVQFPLAIIGTAMGTALLPLLSKQVSQGKKDQVYTTQHNAICAVLFLTIPAALALFMLAFPMIQVMFERGEFTPETTYATSMALMAYAFGLPAFALIKIFANSFFAFGDTKTPVRIAIAWLIIGVTFSIILIGYIGHVGLALSTTISTWGNVITLMILALKNRYYVVQSGLLPHSIKSCICALTMGLVLFTIQLYYPSSDIFIDRLLKLICLIGTGLISYFVASHVIGCYRFQDLRRLIKQT